MIDNQQLKFWHALKNVRILEEFSEKRNRWWFGGKNRANRILISPGKIPIGEG
jgi:hypothetical protein